MREEEVGVEFEYCWTKLFDSSYPEGILVAIFCKVQLVLLLGDSYPYFIAYMMHLLLHGGTLQRSHRLFSALHRSFHFFQSWRTEMR